MYTQCIDEGIQLLEIAHGMKESLMKAGFTLESIVLNGPHTLSAALGVETYVAKLIYDEAKRITADGSLIVAP
jgi:hypothetical protein